jgi:Uncharacterized protein conserved in bacteria (DUF2213)
MTSKVYKVNIALPGVLDYGSNGLLFRDHETLVQDCKSLEGKTFTMFHPKKESDTEILKIGKVKSIVINDSGFSGIVVVDDPLAQKVLDAKAAIEVSPCYHATISKKEEIIDGKTVAGRQTKIWGFKHLSLLEAGRGGEACAVVVDSANSEEYTAEFNDSLTATFELVPPTVVKDILKDSVTTPVVTPDPIVPNTVDFTAVRNFLCVVLDGITDTERNAKNLEEFAQSYITRIVDADIVMDGLSTSQMLTAYTIDKHYKTVAAIKQIEDAAVVKDTIKDDPKPVVKTPALTTDKSTKVDNGFPQFFTAQ